MSELARAGLGEVHAVHGAQVQQKGVYNKAESIIEGARIGERLPDIDKPCILLGQAFADDFVNFAIVGGQALALDDRQTHPEQWDSLLLESPGDLLDAVTVDFLPLVRERLVAVVSVADLLAVVAADHHDSHADLLIRGKEIAHRFRPVVELACDKTGIALGLAHDRDLGTVGIRFLQPLGEQLAEAVAENVDDEGGFRGRLVGEWSSGFVGQRRSARRDGFPYLRLRVHVDGAPLNALMLHHLAFAQPEAGILVGAIAAASSPAAAPATAPAATAPAAGRSPWPISPCA